MNHDECIFCRIIQREIPAKVVYQDEKVLGIEDIHPQAPVHLLVMPRKHISSLIEMTSDDEGLVGHALGVAAQLAREKAVEQTGYRTVINNGPGAGQSVSHLHVHVLGGRAFRWPPG
jgi:histidine triad (HIT) family protein